MALKKSQYIFIGKLSDIKQVEKKIREKGDPVVQRLVEQHGMDYNEAVKLVVRFQIGIEKALRTKPLFPELEMPEGQAQLRAKAVDKRNHARRKSTPHKQMVK